VLITKTNSFVDIFYKVRQRIDAYSDSGMNHTIFYKEKFVMGREKRDSVIHFDWKNIQAQYTNFGKKEKPISLIPGAFDPLSVFYYSRQLKLVENAIFERPITDGKKCSIGRAKVVRKDVVKLPGKTYKTYLLEPELKEVGGVFRKSKNAKIQIWVTADRRKIPVKIKSRVIVGSFSVELVEDIEGNTEADPEKTSVTAD